MPCGALHLPLGVNGLTPPLVRSNGLINDLLGVTPPRSDTSMPVVSGAMNMEFVAKQVIDRVHIVHPDRTIRLTLSGFLISE